MNRRDFVFAAVTVGTVAAGAGFAVSKLWRGKSDSAGPGDLWTRSFPTPDGAPLTMSSLRGKPLLLNFWATWCSPCVVEMPMLDRFAQTERDWNVLALAVDSAEAARRFVAARGLRLMVGMARDTGPDLARQLGNLAGGLPFSVAFDAAGNLVKRRLGALDERLLRSWTAEIR